MTPDSIQRPLDELLAKADLLIAEKLRYEAKLVREASAQQLADRAPATASLRFLIQTDDGWIRVRRSDDNTIVALPSHLKVTLVNTASGRDNIQVLEGLWTGLAANLTTGFLTSTDPQRGTALADFRPRVGGPIEIDGTTYDNQITITSGASTVGPHPAKTDSSNPVPPGTQVVEIADYPHSLGQNYGALGTVWFRIGTSGDRYIHPGRVSAGCITCAPSNWEAIYLSLAKARKNTTQVGDVRTQV